MQTQQPHTTRKNRPFPFEVIGLILLLPLLIEFAFITSFLGPNDPNQTIVLIGFFASYFFLFLLLIVGRTYILSQIFDNGKLIRNLSIALLIMTIIGSIFIRVLSYFSGNNLKDLYTASGTFNLDVYPYWEQFSIFSQFFIVTLAPILIGGLIYWLIVYICFITQRMNRIKELLLRYGLIALDLFFLILLIIRTWVMVYSWTFSEIIYRDSTNNWSFPELLSIDYLFSDIVSLITAIIIALVFFATKHSSRRKRILVACITAFVLIVATNALIDFEVLALLSTSTQRTAFSVGLLIFGGICIVAALIALIRHEGLRQLAEEKTFPTFPLYHHVGIEHSNTFTHFPQERYILNQHITLEESRHYEFKEIKGSRAVSSIQTVFVDYTVAFRNAHGGSIYWGIRDKDGVVVGVNLTRSERDEIRQVVSNKFNLAKPLIPPSDYKIEFHPIYLDGTQENPQSDLFVVEITVSAGDPKKIYFTQNDKAMIKTDGGIAELKGPELAAEVVRRNNLKQ